MIVRLLMHPVAEIVLTSLSLGLVLLSIGLVGSVLWNSPAADDEVRTPAPISVAAVPARLSAVDASLPCVQHSGFLANAVRLDCRQ
jgi:hypothetical protein